MSHPVEKSVHIECSLEHAFFVFTDKIDLWWPPGHRKFQGSRLRLEAHAGGRLLEESPTGDVYVMGEVLKCEPPHHLQLNWFPGAIHKPTQVDLSFQVSDAGTLVRVVHSEGGSNLGPDWPQRALLFTKGWSAVLTAWAAYAEG